MTFSGVVGSRQKRPCGQAFDKGSLARLSPSTTGHARFALSMGFAPALSSSWPFTCASLREWVKRRLAKRQLVTGDTLAQVRALFVLSGFLLFLPYARAMLHDTSLPSTLGFLERRALRILPAYWVCLTILIIVLAPTNSTQIGIGNDWHISRSFTTPFQHITELSTVLSGPSLLKPSFISHFRCWLSRCLVWSARHVRTFA